MRPLVCDYRYGFQGQEKDDEIKGEGNSINYKYRMADVRIGRFFAVDPLTASYPWYSTYSFSGNRVIDAFELEGLEPEFINKEGVTLLKSHSGGVLEIKNSEDLKKQAFAVYESLLKTFYLKKEDGKHVFNDSQVKEEIKEKFGTSNVSELKEIGKYEEAVRMVQQAKQYSNDALSNKVLSDWFFGGQLLKVKIGASSIVGESTDESGSKWTDIGATTGDIGSAIEFFGYGTLLLGPEAVPISGLIISTGKVISVIGLGFELYGQIESRNIDEAAINFVITGVSSGIGGKIDKLYDAGTITVKSRIKLQAINKGGEEGVKKAAELITE